jgi:hypothetical protein
MRGQPSQKEMNKIVFGEPSLVVAEFYDHDTVDSAASHAARKKIMKSVIYIHQVCEEEKAEGRRPMQEQDKRRHPQAWQAYEMRKEHESRNVPDIQPERSIGGAIAQTYNGT